MPIASPPRPPSPARRPGPPAQNAADGPVYYDYMDSPLGRLRLAADAHGLRHVDFEAGRSRWPPAPDHGWTRAAGPLAAARAQLGDYFAGHRRGFDLPLNPRGTPFQRGVWLALAEIPYGATLSYGELARRLGRPLAVRAVGAANGRNPLPIVLPCHRVIGSDGSLTGYGGGLPAKRLLLALEGAAAHGNLFAAAPAP
jgi:methylated-DNA-[protein]-cysteine S-methyltransferase